MARPIKVRFVSGNKPEVCVTARSQVKPRLLAGTVDVKVGRKGRKSAKAHVMHPCEVLPNSNFDTKTVNQMHDELYVGRVSTVVSPVTPGKLYVDGVSST